MKNKYLPKKILIIAPSWIGDTIMAQTLFKQLKKLSPGCQIDVLANKTLYPLFERMPEINKALELPFSHGQLKLFARYQFGHNLKKNKYDQAIILPNSFKSALIPFFAKIPIRTGWLGEMRYGIINNLHLLDKKKLPLMVERYLALSSNKNLPKKYSYPRLRVDEKSLARTLKKFRINLKKPILALCPGAEYGPAKRWPAKYFAKIAKIKSRAGWQVLALGSSLDKSIAARIQTLSGNSCLNLAGKTNLSEVIDLLTKASLVISNDSGLMHIAAALNRPLIIIYGSSSPKFTPPLSKNAKILTLDLLCQPCFKRKCPYGHYRCLRDLKPEVILNN